MRLNQIDALNQRANLAIGFARQQPAGRRNGRGGARARLGVRADRPRAYRVLIAVDNAASRRVADKSGAVYEGTLRAACWSTARATTRRCTRSCGDT